MGIGQIITIIGVSLIIYYAVTQILTFYGVDPSAYITYLIFYASMLISIIILPNSEPKL